MLYINRNYEGREDFPLGPRMRVNQGALGSHGLWTERLWPQPWFAGRNNSQHNTVSSILRFAPLPNPFGHTLSSNIIAINNLGGQAISQRHVYARPGTERPCGSLPETWAFPAFIAILAQWVFGVNRKMSIIANLIANQLREVLRDPCIIIFLPHNA